MCIIIAHDIAEELMKYARTSGYSARRRHGTGQNWARLPARATVKEWGQITRGAVIINQEL